MTSELRIKPQRFSFTKWRNFEAYFSHVFAIYMNMISEGDPDSSEKGLVIAAITLAVYFLQFSKV